MKFRKYFLSSCMCASMFLPVFGPQSGVDFLDERSGDDVPPSYRVEILAAESTEYTPVIETFGSLLFTQKTDISLSVEGRLEAFYVENAG